MYSSDILNSNEQLNELVFTSYLRGDSEDKTLELYCSNNDIVSAPKEYCLTYIKYIYKQFNKEKVFRKLGYKKLDNFELVIIHRFIQNNGIWAFLPQRKISEVLGINQKTVSRYLQKMIKAGIIRVVKKYHYSLNKAHEYLLTSKGIAIVAKILKGRRKDSFLSRQKANYKTGMKWFKEKLKVIKIAGEGGYSYATGEVADLYEETVRKAKLAKDEYIKLQILRGN